MGAPRLRITLRQGLALAALAAGAAAAWFLLLRDDSPRAGNAPPERPPGVSERAGELVRSLSIEQQVDQVLLVGFEGTDATAPIVAELSQRQLGGVLVGADNWAGAAAGVPFVAELARAGRSGGRIPPLIAAAHEGGVYRAFADLPSDTRALEIGDTGSSESAETWALDAAQALADSGFHLNLFPVADVATIDSPVADRAFSDDPVLVAELSAAALRGCAAADLACAPLHFPGLGAASQDPTQGPATVSLDDATLQSRDLVPFRAAVAERAPALVVSLAFYAAYDPVVPAALTPEVATELLRDELAFEGVAVSDNLGSGAIKATYSVPDAAVQALAAGIDLLQIASPEDQAGVSDALARAVEAGEVPESRLAEAAGRVLELKRRLGLIE